MPDWFSFVPHQWVGILAVGMIVMTLIAHLVEKYPAFAKIIPLGTWFHERARKRHRRLDWIAEDNEVIAGLQKQMETLSTEMKSVQDSVRCFRAWSVYDAGWHHRDAVTATESGRHAPRHYDYFEFETIWKASPEKAAKLSLGDLGGWV